MRLSPSLILLGALGCGLVTGCDDAADHSAPSSSRDVVRELATKELRLPAVDLCRALADVDDVDARLAVLIGDDAELDFVLSRSEGEHSDSQSCTGLVEPGTDGPGFAVHATQESDIGIVDPDTQVLRPGCSLPPYGGGSGQYGSVGTDCHPSLAVSLEPLGVTDGLPPWSGRGDATPSDEYVALLADVLDSLAKQSVDD